MLDLLGNRFDFLDLGPASANRSAAILGCALVGSVWLFLQKRRRWHWIGLFLGIGFSVLLLATKSRGGVIAAICGFGLIGFIERPRVPRRLLIVGGFLLFALAVYGSLHGVWGRFTYGDTSREGLWRAGLAMLWDMPDGVGEGNAADFYAQWYQEIGDRRGYLTLINYHLTWLVEHGLVARLGYALGWASVAWIVWPCRLATQTTVAAAVWLVFFVAAIFSTIANVWQVWVLPLSALGLVLSWRIYTGEWASFKIAAKCVATAIFALIALHVVGWRLSSPELTSERGVVRYAGAEPAICLYAPSNTVLGAQWGHDVRISGRAVWVIPAEISVPSGAGLPMNWVLSDGYPEALPLGAHISVLNQVATPELLVWLERQSPALVEVTLSDSLCRELRCEDWIRWTNLQPNSRKINVLGAAGIYVPDWLTGR